MAALVAISVQTAGGEAVEDQGASPRVCFQLTAKSKTHHLPSLGLHFSPVKLKKKKRASRDWRHTAVSGIFVMT